MSFAVTIKWRGDKRRPKHVQERMKRGITPVGSKIAKAMRAGVVSQFAREEYEGYNLRKKWVRTKQFGNRPPPAKTMQRTGSYLRAWRGGAGSTTRFTRQSVAVGISGFPQVGVHQNTKPTVIKVTRRMFFFVLKTFGVTLGKTVTIQPRAVGLNKAVGTNVYGILGSYYLTGAK